VEKGGGEGALYMLNDLPSLSALKDSLTRFSNLRFFTFEEKPTATTLIYKKTQKF
jgi:hypothetical protein